MLQVDGNFLYLLIFRVVSIYLLALFSGSHGKLVWKVKVSSVDELIVRIHTCMQCLLARPLCVVVAKGQGRHEVAPKIPVLLWKFCQ